jgi:hypothetical protein
MYEVQRRILILNAMEVQIHALRGIVAAANVVVDAPGTTKFEEEESFARDLIMVGRGVVSMLQKCEAQK